MKIKVMSWNINQGKDLEGICRHIADEQPDIVCLQEAIALDANTVPSVDTASSIVEWLKENNCQYLDYFLPAFQTDRHPNHYPYGNAILYKISLEITPDYPHNIPLSPINIYWKRGFDIVPRDAEPRNAVSFSFKISGGESIEIINTHLACSKECEPTEYTDIQMPKLMRLIGDGKRKIVMGDFNMDFYNNLESEAVQKYRRMIENAGMKNVDPEQKPTWPLTVESARHHWQAYNGGGGRGGKEIGVAPEPEFKTLTHRLDQIFVGEGIEVVPGSFRLGESTASDHKSLIAELEV